MAKILDSVRRQILAHLNKFIVVSGITVVGSVLLIATHAATPVVSVEPEIGGVTSTATVTNDATASGSKAVKFGTVAASTTGFTHPGILLSRAQLDFVKSKIASGAQPWTAAYNTMLTSGTGNGGRYSSLTYNAQPVPSVQCVGASGNTALNSGCQAQTDDAIAAYTDALIYYYTGNTAYATKSIAIMNAWSSTLQEIKFDTTTYTNGLLQAGWTAQTITRAAEIIRYNDAGWQATDVQNFETMLKNIYLPHVNHGWTGGGANWLSTLSDATIDIGIFTNDRTTFDLGVSQWRQWAPTIIYMSSDVNPYPQLAGYPIPPKGTNYDKSTTTPTTMNTYWRNPSGFYQDGLEGETCRDISHTTMGLEGLVMGAETARIQGVDLYGEQQTRLVAGFEFNSRYAVQQLSTGSVPANLCGGILNTGGTGYVLGYEIAYNALASRRGIAMPNTKILIDNYTRPATYNAGLFMDWEQLTHAGTP